MNTALFVHILHVNTVLMIILYGCNVNILYIEFILTGVERCRGFLGKLKEVLVF